MNYINLTANDLRAVSDYAQYFAEIHKCNQYDAYKMALAVTRTANAEERCDFQWKFDNYVATRQPRNRRTLLQSIITAAPAAKDEEIYLLPSKWIGDA